MIKNLLLDLLLRALIFCMIGLWICLIGMGLWRLLKTTQKLDQPIRDEDANLSLSRFIINNPAISIPIIFIFGGLLISSVSVIVSIITGATYLVAAIFF